jgi:hypothetical protein
MLCAGAVRSKGTSEFKFVTGPGLDAHSLTERGLTETLQSPCAVNILLQTILDAAVSAIAFYVVGFGFAYGIGDNDNGFVSAARAVPVFRRARCFS